MADKIKKFFAKKKADTRFKLAGPGRKLNSDTPPTTSKQRLSKEVYVPPSRTVLSEESRNAADAALARLKPCNTKEFNTSLAAIQAQVKRELEAEKKSKEELEKLESKKSEVQTTNVDFAVQGVYFRCPLVSEEVLSRKEWKVKIKEFLYEQLADERGLTACLIIYNCNVKDKAEQCVETLCKYLENILNNPTEEKYRKIRMSNRIFCDKVANCEGALEFLQAAGFTEIELDNEKYLIWSENNTEQEDQLSILLDALKCSETINLELDRNLQVLLPSQAKKTQLPPDFFRISPEEIKREQQLKAEIVDSTQMLKTKAMREKEELRVMNRYKFALIRVRFPDGIYLQGTFNVYEKFAQIYEFVRSCLKNESDEFSLVSPLGHKFVGDDYEKSLYDLRLVPTTVFNFGFENAARDHKEFLKDDLLMLIQSF